MRRPTGAGRAGLAMLVLAFALLAGCGRKLPPIQPGSYPPPAVKDLAYQVRGEDIVLTWSVPRAQPEKDSPAAGFRVLRSRQTEPEAECVTCPPKFQEVGNLRPSGPDASDSMQFRDRLETGYHYQFKVRSYSDQGREGRDSNVVHLTF
jgi:hypothetical protein